MKAEWTVTGPGTVTLGDDSTRVALVLESFGQKITEQVDDLAFATYASRIARGNRQGEIVFTASKSHASLDAMASYLSSELARLNQTGSLVLTFTAHTLTMANANLVGVERAGGNGVWLIVRYRFGITTVAYA